MGALTGTLTYKQYYVEGDLPDKFRDQFLEALQANAFRDIGVDAGDDRSHGWVNVRDILDADFYLDKFLFNQYICLALRQDVIKIPSTTLKVYVQKEEALTRERTKRDKLTKFERDEIKEMLTIQLRKKMLPTIRSYDMVWNLDAHTLWFWTHNKATCELFEELFERTFGLKLVPHNTFTALSFGGVSERDLERTVALEPVDFVNGR